MTNSNENQERLKVFVSYARADLELADQLVAALAAIGFDLLIDRHAISVGEDWQERLGTLIAEADSVILLLSPKSLESDRVTWEIAESERLSKRLMPVVVKRLDSTPVPDRLRELQQIFLYAEPKQPGSGFGKGLGDLVEALNTDIDWVREHTRLGQRSTEWHAGGRQGRCCLGHGAGTGGGVGDHLGDMRRLGHVLPVFLGHLGLHGFDHKPRGVKDVLEIGDPQLFARIFR